MLKRYLSRKEASEYLESLGLTIAPATLAKYATIGGGPKYYSYNRQAKYAKADLDSWAARRLGEPKDSTSAEMTDKGGDDE